MKCRHGVLSNDIDPCLDCARERDDQTHDLIEEARKSAEIVFAVISTWHAVIIAQRIETDAMREFFDRWGTKMPPDMFVAFAAAIEARHPLNVAATMHDVAITELCNKIAPAETDVQINPIESN